MSRGFLFFVTFLFAAFWTISGGMLNYQRSQKAIQHAEAIYANRVKAMGHVLAASIRSDLLRGNIREARRKLESFRGTGFLTGFDIVSTNIDRSYSGVNQILSEGDITHREPITYSLDSSSPPWGYVNLIFTPKEVQGLRADLSREAIFSTAGNALSIAIVILLMGLMLGFYNSHLFLILEKSLIDRRQPKQSAWLNYIFKPMLAVVSRVRGRLDQAELDQQKYVQSMTLHKAARQIAHDIRGPLTFIKFCAQKFSETNSEVSKSLVTATERLENMGTQLLRMRNDHASVPALNVPQLIGRLKNYLAYKAEEIQPFRIDFDVAPEMTTSKGLQIDYALLERVIDNLINNAIEATPDANQPIVVSLSCVAGRLTIEVADTGTGMSESALAAFKSDSTGFTSKANGHGIGLPFCKQVISQAGGEITYISSQDGAGCSLTLSLPLI